MQPQGLPACQKPKRGPFPGWLYKTELEGDPETFIFGFMKIFDFTQPGGPAESSISVWGFDKWSPF